MTEGTLPQEAPYPLVLPHDPRTSVTLGQFCWYLGFMFEGPQDRVLRCLVPSLSAEPLQPVQAVSGTSFSGARGCSCVVHASFARLLSCWWVIMSKVAGCECLSVDTH